MEPRLILFDLDHTLVGQTEEHVIYTDEHGVEHRIKHHKMHERGLRHDEVSWDEFMYGRVFADTATALPLISTAEHMRRSGPVFEMAIVTARQTPLDPMAFIRKMNDLGLGVGLNDFYFTGDYHDLYDNYWDRKKHAIRERLFCADYQMVMFLDDDHRNLDAFLELQPEFPGIRFYPLHVIDGEVHRYPGGHVAAYEVRREED